MNSAFDAALEPVSAPPRAPTPGATAGYRFPNAAAPAARSAAAPELATTLPARTNVSTAPAVGSHCLTVPPRAALALLFPSPKTSAANVQEINNGKPGPTNAGPRLSNSSLKYP